MSASRVEWVLPGEEALGSRAAESPSGTVASGEFWLRGAGPLRLSLAGPLDGARMGVFLRAPFGSVLNFSLDAIVRASARAGSLPRRP